MSLFVQAWGIGGGKKIKNLDHTLAWINSIVIFLFIVIKISDKALIFLLPSVYISFYISITETIHFYFTDVVNKNIIYSLINTSCHSLRIRRKTSFLLFHHSERCDVIWRNVFLTACIQCFQCEDNLSISAIML